MTKLITPGYPRKESVDLNVTPLNGHVVLQFSRSIQELPLTPQEAAELSRALAKITASLTGPDPLN